MNYQASTAYLAAENLLADSEKKDSRQPIFEEIGFQTMHHEHLNNKEHHFVIAILPMFLIH